MTENTWETIVTCYPALKTVDPQMARRITAEAVSIKAPAGRELFTEAAPCTHFPLLVNGIIRASKRSPDGHEILLYRLHPGDCCVITTTSLLGETPYPAMAQVEEDVTVFGIPRDLFLDLILGTPDFRLSVFQFLSQRKSHLMKLIDDVAFRRVDQRLASRLLGQVGPLEVTHQMLADELGTTREVVSRALESFQESGFLRLGRKRIEILDPQALDQVYRTELS
jgi:CRP/FNR family transcriptional regulator